MTPAKKRLVTEAVPKKRCRYCFSTDNLTYDHKTPIARGGKDDVSNIQVLCKVCNQTKSKLTNGEIFVVARWLWQVNEKRAVVGKRPLAITRKRYEGLKAA